MSIRRTVVEAIEHDVFESDAPGVVHPRIGPAGRQQFRQRVLAVKRYQFVAQLVGHGMQ